MRLSRVCSVKQWNKSGPDFRSLITFKNLLFDSPDLTRENKIPISEFRRIRAEHDNGQIKAQLCGTEDAVVTEISDDQGFCDLNVFADIVDLLVFLPSKDLENQNMQKSPAIH